MITASLLATLAVALLAIGTPRQAQLFATLARDSRRRRTLRLAGFTLLAGVLLMLAGNEDCTRHLIALIGVLGMAAIAATLIFTLTTQRRG